MFGTVWQSFGAHLTTQTNLLQMMKSESATTIHDISSHHFDDVREYFANQKEFCIVGYSFGSLIALELARMLEKNGSIGRLFLIDGAPIYLQQMAAGIVDKTMKDADPADVLIMVLYFNLCSANRNEKFNVQMQACSTWEQKIDTLYEYLDDEVKETYSLTYLHRLVAAMANRLKAVNLMDTNLVQQKLNSRIVLLRPQAASFHNVVEDYELSKYSTQPIDVHYIQGNHLTVLDNVRTSEIINEFAPIA